MTIDALLLGSDSLSPDLHEKFVGWLTERLGYSLHGESNQEEHIQAEQVIALSLDKNGHGHSSIPTIKKALEAGKKAVIFATVLEKSLISKELSSFPGLKIESIYALREALRHDWSTEMAAALSVTH